MALGLIPLNHFLDCSDRQRPKGLLTMPHNGVPFGLTSAMRNPMAPTPGAIYDPYILVDFRPRDNWNIAGNTEDKRGAGVNAIAPYLNTDMKVDPDGLYIQESAIEDDKNSGLIVENDENNGLFSLERDAPKIAVMLAAIKVMDNIAPDSSTTAEHSRLGLFSSGNNRINGQLLHDTGNDTFNVTLYNHANDDSFQGVPDPTASVLITASKDKWFLLQVLSGTDPQVGATDVTVRVLGGQFPLIASKTVSFNSVHVAGLVPPFQVWGVNQFRMPVRKKAHARLAFATLAMYNAYIPNPPSTAESAIQWLEPIPKPDT